MSVIVDLASADTPTLASCSAVGGASLDWIAEQMGHTSGNMIRKHYGTWINEDGPDVIAILEHALGMGPI